MREGAQLDEMKEDESKSNYETYAFQIFEVDLSSNTWKEVKNLGNKALFLGDNSSFSIEVLDVTRCKSNCIYFTDDCRESYCSPDFCGRGGGKDMGIYNIQDKSIEPYIRKVVCGKEKYNADAIILAVGISTLQKLVKNGNDSALFLNFRFIPYDAALCTQEEFLAVLNLACIDVKSLLNFGLTGRRNHVTGLEAANQVVDYLEDGSFAKVIMAEEDEAHIEAFRNLNRRFNEIIEQNKFHYQIISSNNLFIRYLYGLYAPLLVCCYI
ncbi:hypothetical protein QYF36_023305 [Acer negundo]|nr:hypothetical protein QYF36_013555 [Acer negundo]KAK4844692.1 hypothetical protein QYF36_023305 [Acer negundo]